MEKVKEMMEKKNHDLRKAAGNNSVPLKQTTLLCTLMFVSVEDILNFHSWKIKRKRKKTIKKKQKNVEQKSKIKY